MKASFLIVFNRIPKKWFSTLGTIVFTNIFFIPWLLNQPIEGLPRILVIIGISLGVIIFYFTVMTIVYSLQIIKELNAAIENQGHIRSTDIVIKKKDKLRSHIEIHTIISDGLWEIKVSVRRRWLPSEPRPNVEDFIESIKYSEPHCGLCHSNLEHGYLFGHSRGGNKCTNPECENSRKILIVMSLYDQCKDVANQFAGQVRSDYDKYWELYKSTYQEITNGKPEKYQAPLN